MTGIDLHKSNISDLDRRVLEAMGIALKVGDDNLGDIAHDDEVSITVIQYSIVSIFKTA